MRKITLDSLPNYECHAYFFNAKTRSLKDALMRFFASLRLHVFALKFLFSIKNILLVILLCACTSTGATAWNVSHQKGSQKQFDSARLSYPIHDKVNGVAVEMIYAKNSLRTYLEVHSQMIPPYQGNPKEALVKIKTREKIFQGIAHRHQGGQRATLPTDLQETVVNHLLNDIPVTIELVGYSTTLQPGDFKLSYNDMQKAPLKIPVQLPFKI